jgi:hypothetical protein
MPEIIITIDETGKVIINGESFEGDSCKKYLDGIENTINLQEVQITMKNDDNGDKKEIVNTPHIPMKNNKNKIKEFLKKVRG